jgi:hypothetical protein
MAAPALTAATKYINPGTTKVYWVASISNKLAPTRGELNAGTDVTAHIADNSGWKVESDQVETPDMDTRFTSTIPGRTKADDSSITFYCDVAGADARALMPRDTNGFVVWMDGGDVTGRKMDVFPVRVSSLGKERAAKGDDAATVEIAFAITSEPATDVTIP